MMKLMAKHDPHNFLHYILTVIYVFITGILSTLIFVAMSAAGYLVFRTAISPYDKIIGLPLMLLGVGLIINNLDSEFLSVFSRKFNKGICPICRKKDE